MSNEEFNSGSIDVDKLYEAEGKVKDENGFWVASIEETNKIDDDLPFAKAEVVRLMKENLDKDKMIRERVKVEMNRFLGQILKDICKQLNDYPYTTVEYDMLKEVLYPYQNITRINDEKERILLHLEAIKSDCNALQSDVNKTLKLKDTKEEENLFKL